MKRFFTLFLTVLFGVLISLVCVGCDCSHNWGEWIPIKDKTCLDDGEARRVCTKCGESETMILKATGYHVFGEWTTSGKYKQRTCSVCGYKEQQDNLEENEDSELITGIYETFDQFLTACSQEGTIVTYRGAANSIAVNLTSVNERCDGHLIIIPKMMLSIKFIGRVQGSPFQNLKIVVADRTSNLDITFENVDIETNGTIISSSTQKITVSLTMEGSLCRFVNTSKAARGSDGAYNKYGGPSEVIEPGHEGETGSPSIMINGTCNVYCKAKHLVVKGGEGGDGGNGTSAGWPGHTSGDGGNGGKGGAAFRGDNLVNVYAVSGATVEILGGNGGNGGVAGGNTALGKKKYGRNGYSGSVGDTGCNSVKSLPD